LPATVRQVADALRAGYVVAAFPEGTTWCGASTGRFRPALFQAAVDAGVPIVPVSLGYWSSGRRTAVPAFVGDDTLWRSVRRVLAVRGLEVRATAGSALHPVPLADRRVLARIAELAVRGGDPREHRAGVPMRAAALDLAA
ncbi:MAG TPA: 1-acyl-sn-glycerol-3-phosphate acyltransferase, partial [Pilimelia sp.]|nr:1-acyl-sn-glycerol-3-phosphate acyltransferase [Pilimelia sp.]